MSHFAAVHLLPLETDVTERLPVGVADGEQGVRFIDGPRRDGNGRGSRNRRARDQGNRRTSAPSDCNGLTVPDGSGDQRLGDARLPNLRCENIVSVL